MLNWWTRSLTARRTIGAAGGLLALAILGALVLRAGGGLGASPQSNPSGPLLFGAPAVATATDTPLPAPTATDTPLAQATATPTPLPPTPTPTPAPLPVTFTCASGATSQGSSSYLLLHVCVQGPANSQVAINAFLCASAPSPAAVNSVANTGASGAWSSGPWQIPSDGCALPLTITLKASGHDAVGDALVGSTSFTVSS